MHSYHPANEFIEGVASYAHWKLMHHHRGSILEMSTYTVFDVIVVGAGVEGSATAYQLIKHGAKRVLLLEQVQTGPFHANKSLIYVISHVSFVMTSHTQICTNQYLLNTRLNSPISFSSRPCTVVAAHMAVLASLAVPTPSPTTSRWWMTPMLCGTNWRGRVGHNSLCTFTSFTYRER